MCAFDFVAKRFFRQKPKNLAFEVDFNRVDVEGHAPDTIERKLGDFERPTASVIRRISSEGQLPRDEDFSYVLNLISLLAVRNPALRRSMTNARRHEFRVIGELLVTDKRLYEHHLREACEAGLISGKDVSFEEMRRFVQKDDYAIEISPQEYLLTELDLFKRILPWVSSRHWTLLIAKPDAPDFITCDRPASLVYRQMVFPMDGRHAVLGDRERPAPRRVDLEAAGVAEVNLRLLRLADRQVCSPTPGLAVLDGGGVVRVPLSETGRFRS